MSILHDPAASPAAIVSFSFLAVGVVGVAVAGISRAESRSDLPPAGRARKAALVLLGWLALTSALAASGVLGKFELVPPPLPVLVMLTTVCSTIFAFSSVGTMLARELPLAALIGFQAFRLPLEMTLHRLCTDGVLPVQMTYYGMNVDILTGITAIPLALWAAYATPPRFVLRLWNIFGVTLLLTIVTIAVLSMPSALRVFVNEPANTIVATVPFVWLPTVLVQAAWIGHLLLFRRIGRRIWKQTRVSA